MRSLKEKLKKQGGFTLVEMLIVVAIIAILVAVSIPIVSYSIESTKHSTDAANERAAKAEMLLIALASDADATTETIEDGKAYVYDAGKGKLLPASTSLTVAGYGKHGGHAGDVLGLLLTSNNEVCMSWFAGASSVTASNLGGLDSGLCSTNESSHTPG